MSENDDIINSLMEPARLNARQMYPGKGPTLQEDTPFAQWANRMGTNAANTIANTVKNPENIVGTKSLGIMAGPMARTANTDAYHEAMHQLLNNKAPQRIFAKTGWFPRQEGQLAFEIPDTSAIPRPLPKGIKPTDTVEGAYSSFVDHPKAFEAYPGLADVRLQINPSLGGNARLEPGLNKIIIGGSPDRYGLMPSQMERLMHETQHYVQGEEGWPFSAGPQMHRDEAFRVFNKELRENPRNTEVKGILKALMRGSKAESNWDDPAFQMYNRSPSEVEARNVQNRFRNEKYGYPFTDQNAASLRLRGPRAYPRSTEDVAPDKQFDYWGNMGNFLYRKWQQEQSLRRGGR